VTEIETVPAHRVDQVDDYHGERVADPYRWLEDTNSPETSAWIEAENAVTQRWLSAVAARQQIAERLTQLWDYPRLGAPFERGGHWFQWRNSGLQNQAVLYVMEDPTAPGRVLLDPNVLAGDGTVSVSSFALTQDGGRLAYATNDAGSDWMTWHVRDVSTGHDLPDVVAWAKFSDASWLKDGSGFYYGAPDPPAAGAELLAATSPRKL
jgi:prolyl oligopeptidase